MIKMAYLKKPIDAALMDSARISISVYKTPSGQKSLSPEPVCDFCGGPHPKWIYAAQHQSTGQPGPCWRWMACAGCSRLVDADAWEALLPFVAERIRELGLLPQGAPPALLIRATRASLEVFQREAIPCPGIQRLRSVRLSDP